MNMGVWDHILDLNGVDKLAAEPPYDPGLRADTNLVALGNLPLCGMNTAFTAELTPAFFFLPDLWIDGWQLSRHDDIWGGYVVKKLMDRRGDLLDLRPSGRRAHQADPPRARRDARALDAPDGDRASTRSSTRPPRPYRDGLVHRDVRRLRGRVPVGGRAQHAPGPLPRRSTASWASGWTAGRRRSPRGAVMGADRRVRVAIDATALGSGQGGDETMLRGLLEGLAATVEPGDVFPLVVRDDVTPARRRARPPRRSPSTRCGGCPACAPLHRRSARRPQRACARRPTWCAP